MTAAVVAVSVPVIASGVNGSMLIPRTTNTSRSSGDRFKSTLDCVKVLAPDSVVRNPIAIGLDVCFNPRGMDGVTQGRTINYAHQSMLNLYRWLGGKVGFHAI